MKKILLVLAMMFLTTSADAYVVSNVIVDSGSITTIPTYHTLVTSNTVSFNTTRMVVTFNTTVRDILFINESATDTMHISLTPANETEVKTQSSSTIGAFKLSAGASIKVEISTGKIGFIKATSSLDSGNLQYVATTDTGTQP